MFNFISIEFFILVSKQINECCLGTMSYMSISNNSANINTNYQMFNLNSATTSTNTENNQFITNNIEEVEEKEYFGDLFNLNKYDKIMYISLNIRRLRAVGWNKKNNTFRDFCIRSKVDIIEI